MAKIMSLGGAGLSESSGERCRCVRNPRTKRGAKLCFVGKSSRNRSGWQFVKGGCQPKK
jgi:hypothetical protein